MKDRRTIFSPCHSYRYVLWREWGTGNFTICMFVGLNPSTADETKNDPTVRRCMDYAKSWGYGGLYMTNLFAFRATDPRRMMAAPKPIGPENDKWLVACARDADVIIAAWGIRGQFLRRDEEVLKLITGVRCLRVTKDGHPEHPLYLAKTLRPIHYR